MTGKTLLDSVGDWHSREGGRVNELSAQRYWRTVISSFLFLS